MIMRFAIILAVLALARAQLRPVPEPVDIRTCLSTVQQTITEWENMGNGWMRAKKDCCVQCRPDVPPQIASCLPQPGSPEQEQKQRMMEEMHRELREGISRGVQALQSELASNPSLCSDPSQAALKPGDVSKLDKLNGHVVQGPFCFMAMMSRFFPRPNRKCMCDCIRGRLGPNMVPSLGDIAEKISWFRDQRAQGFPPDAIVKHSPKHAALCIFQACDKETVKRAVQAAGLRRIKGKMMCGMMKMMKKFPEKCECMARGAGTVGVPGAPTVEDCRCLVPQVPEPMQRIMENIDCENIEQAMSRLGGPMGDPNGSGPRFGGRGGLLSTERKDRMKETLMKLFKGGLPDSCGRADKCRGWMVDMLEEMRENMQSGPGPLPGAPRFKRDVADEDEISEFLELADFVLE